MLTGDAKRAYQREYMRRKRAGLPTRKRRTAKPRKLTQRMRDDIARWGEDGAQVIAGLRLDNDVDRATAARRYLRLAEARRAARERAKQEAGKPMPRACMFCGETKASKPRRVFVGDGLSSAICSTCVAKAAAVVARTKALPQGMQEMMAEGWRRSWAIRQELEAAAAEIKRNGRIAK